MELIDVTKPTKLSPRAEAQVRKLREEEKAAEGALSAIKKRINKIVDVDRLRADEGEESITKRLRQYRNRQGWRQVRFHLTKQRKAAGAAEGKQLLKAFKFIEAKCGKAGFMGAEIRVEEIARHLKLSKRQAQRILNRLENETPHRAPSLVNRKARNPGIIFRVRVPGKAWRLAVTMPESTEYLKELQDTLNRSIAVVATEESLAPLAAA